VIEEDGTETLNVLPIRNPAKRAAHYSSAQGPGGTFAVSGFLMRANTIRQMVEFAN
jgi:hypothetical protein